MITFHVGTYSFFEVSTKQCGEKWQNIDLLASLLELSTSKQTSERKQDPNTEQSTSRRACSREVCESNIIIIIFGLLFIRILYFYLI